MNYELRIMRKLSCAIQNIRPRAIPGFRSHVIPGACPRLTGMTGNLAVLSVATLLLASCSVYDNYSVEAYNSFGGSVGSGGLSGKCPEKFLDERDGNSYYLTKIGDQCWFAENLKYETRSAKCYEGLPENCSLFGRLYKFADIEGACPKGTSVPTKSDWESLDSFVHASNAGYFLKSDEYWESRSGVDKYGFNAFPAGKVSDDGKSVNLLNWTGFWSSTDYADDDDQAWFVYLNSSSVEFNKGGLEKENYISIRCIVL